MCARAAWQGSTDEVFEADLANEGEIEKEREDEERIGGGRGRNSGVVGSEDDEESPSKKQRGAAQNAHDKENEPRQQGSPATRDRAVLGVRQPEGLSGIDMNNEAEHILNADNPYDVLGVGHGATDEEVKNAHDRIVANLDRLPAWANEKRDEIEQRLSEAFDVLRSEEARAQYEADVKEAELSDQIANIRATHHDKEADQLTREGAMKILDLRAPGRFVRDVTSSFWSCDPEDNRWSMDESRWATLLRDFEKDLGIWAEKPGELKTYILSARKYHDDEFHEKLDHTLASGMIAFRNGMLLDLRTNDPKIRALQPEDYVSMPGTIDRKLPDYDEVVRQWGDDGKRDNLEAVLRKNFSDMESYQQVMERIAWAVLHGKPNESKWWAELAGPADGGKTMLLTALAKCLPGLVKSINISLFSTAEKKSSSGPNEALCELQGVRLAYAEEPSKDLVLDGGFLKDLCGGVEMSTSRKYKGQIRFETTFHPFLISNSDACLDISPNDAATRAKRVGWRMMNTFAPPGDASIDNVTVFAADNGLRELIGNDYRISMICLLHEHYQRVLAHGFDATETDYKIDFPPPEVKRGIQYYVGLYDVYDIPRGDATCFGMDTIYIQLSAEGIGINNELSQQQFFSSAFKAAMVQKIKTFRAANGITGSGGPRLASPRGESTKKFFGIRLRTI